MKRFILLLCGLGMLLGVPSCGPLEGGADPLDGVAPTNVGSMYYRETGAGGVRGSAGLDSSADF